MAGTDAESFPEWTEASVNRCRWLDDALSMSERTIDRRAVFGTLEVLPKPGISEGIFSREETD